MEAHSQMTPPQMEECDTDTATMEGHSQTTPPQMEEYDTDTATLNIDSINIHSDNNNGRKTLLSDEDFSITIDETMANLPVLVNPSNIRNYVQRPYPQPQLFFSAPPVPYSLNNMFDITYFSEAPWREPDVDTSDYFNYGFDEYTWWQYSRVLRNICHYRAPRLSCLPDDRPIFEVCANELKEKPWLLQEADPSDFFNRGLDPNSWNDLRAQVTDILEKEYNVRPLRPSPTGFAPPFN